MPATDHNTRSLRRVTIGATSLAVCAIAIVLWYAFLHRDADPLARANDAYETGRWNVAAELARAALNRRRDDPTALRLLARASVRLGRDDTAIAIYSRRLDPKAIEAEDRVLLGQVYEHRGRPDMAALEWSKVLEAPDVTPQSLEELARLHLQSRRWEQAIPVAERLSRRKGWEARGSMMLGTIRAALNDVAGAAVSFHRAVESDPSEVDKSHEPAQLRKLIAKTWLRVGEPTDARPLLLSILDRVADPEAAWLLSRAYLQEGNKSQALTALQGAGSYRSINPLENEPSPYVGEARCEKCHQTIFRESLASRHTQSYSRGTELSGLPLPDHPLPDPDDPEVTHTFRRNNGAILHETRVGTETFSAIIEYAFGTKDRYLTMVGLDTSGGYRIARMSYYETAEGRGWDRSALDHAHLTRAQGADFLGEPIGVRDGLAKCFYCHITNPRAGREATGPEAADRAVGCERCHGPGGNHIAAVDASFADLAIVSPALATPAAVTTKQCNDCHILDRGFRADNVENPAWIRSQSVGWTFSRCNTESGGSFGCVTCHDPHKSALATTTSQYAAKCLTCHAASKEQVATGKPKSMAGTAPAAPCPVNPATGCISCHMPRVRIDSLHLELSDHYIRVHRALR